MISLIVARDKNNLIGKANDLPWNYPEDLKYFQKITKGKAVLMGYNTYLSIFDRLKKPLPNRENYVITFEDSLIGNPHIVQGNIENFLLTWPKDKELIIIGGKSIYEWLYRYSDIMYITEIDKEYEGDVYLNISLDNYDLVSTTQGSAPELHFNIYKKK